VQASGKFKEKSERICNHLP